MTTATIAELGLWLLAGMALGAVYLALVQRTVAAITQDTASKGAAAGWLALRFALAAAVLAAAAVRGTGPLLLTLLGFLLVRSLVIRRMRRADAGR
jgi:hypothetical protein